MTTRKSSIVLLILLFFYQGITSADSSINGRFLLLDHFGEAVTDADFNGKFRLIFFGYTHCPDVCPTSLATVTAVMNALGEDAERVQPLFISVDSDRDKPETLRNFVTYFHPKIIGLTGSSKMIERTAKNFKVRYEKVVNPGDDPNKKYWMDHTAALYLMAPDGNYLTKFAYGISPKQILDKMRNFL